MRNIIVVAALVLVPRPMPLAAAAGSDLATQVSRLHEDAMRSPDGEWTLLFAPPTKKILRRMDLDKNVFHGGAVASIELAKNEHEAIQIVIVPHWKGTDVKQIQVELTPLRHKESDDECPTCRVRWHPVGYLSREKNSTPAAEKWPDVLLPAGSFSVRGQQLQPIWVDVHAGEETPSGDYELMVRIRLAGTAAAIEAKINVHVFDFVIPQAHSLPTAIGATIPATRDLLYQYRLERRRLMQPGPPFDDYTIKDHEFRELAEVKPMIEAELDKFRAIGGKMFMLPIPHFKGDTGSWHPVGGVFSIDVAFNPEDAAYIVRYHRELATWLRQRDALQDAYVYLWDEPSPRRHPNMRALRGLIREADPDIRCLAAMGLNKELIGEVDIWCTGVWQWAEARELAQEIVERGDQLWWYNAAHLGANPTTDLLWTRLLFWSIWKHRIDGYLQWTADMWYAGENREDCLGSLLRDGETTDCWWSKGPDEYEGAGLTVLPTPGRHPFNEQGHVKLKKGEALPTIRLEAMRDGLEDYEYFVTLSKMIAEAKRRGTDQKQQDEIADAAKLLTVPPEIESDAFDAGKMTHLTSDDVLVQDHRRRLAKAIEALAAD